MHRWPHGVELPSPEDQLGHVGTKVVDEVIQVVDYKEDEVVEVYCGTLLCCIIYH